MKEHLYLLKFSLKLQSGWSVLIALSLVLALEGTHFFWFAFPHVIFNKYYRYLCPILLSSVTDCNYFPCSTWTFNPVGSVILSLSLHSFMFWAVSYLSLFWNSFAIDVSVTHWGPLVSLTMANKELREITMAANGLTEKEVDSLGKEIQKEGKQFA